MAIQKFRNPDTRRTTRHQIQIKGSGNQSENSSKKQEKTQDKSNEK